MKICGHLARNARIEAPTCLVTLLWFACGSLCLWGKLLQNLSFSKSFFLAGMARRDMSTCFMTCPKSFCVTGTILLQGFQHAQHFRRVLLRVFANRLVSAASSGLNIQVARQAWDTVRVSFCVARAAFGEDPSCMECYFAWPPLRSTLYT